MTNPVELKIEQAVNDLRRGYARALKTVRRLKGRINKLERSRAEEGSMENCALSGELESAVDQLDAFVDSWILEVKDAWNRYRTLEKEFATVKKIDPKRLNALKDLCEQSELLAKDLLCYSLGHLRPVGKPLAARA